MQDVHPLFSPSIYPIWQHMSVQWFLFFLLLSCIFLGLMVRQYIHDGRRKRDEQKNKKIQQKRIQENLLAFSQLALDDPWLWENMHQLLSEIFSDITLRDMSSQTCEECIQTLALDPTSARCLIDFRDRYYADTPDGGITSLHKKLDALCHQISRCYLLD